MNKKELRQMIHEEMYKLLPGLLKEAVSSVLTAPVSPKPSLRERSAAKPVAFDRKKLAEQMGYGEFSNGGTSSGMTLTVGNQEITPDQMPDDVAKALTRDYSSLVKAMTKKK